MAEKQVKRIRRIINAFARLTKGDKASMCRAFDSMPKPDQMRSLAGMLQSLRQVGDAVDAAPAVEKDCVCVRDCSDVADGDADG